MHSGTAGADPLSRPIILHCTARLNAIFSGVTEVPSLASHRNHKVLLQLAIRLLVSGHPHLLTGKADTKNTEGHPSSLLLSYLFEAEEQRGGMTSGFRLVAKSC